MTEEREKKWYSKIKEASVTWFKENPDYNPAFNYYDSGEITIPNDTNYYRIPIEMWKEYHKELYNSEIK
jgi:hypothetical protein